jgi:hypothetical protein
MIIGPGDSIAPQGPAAVPAVPAVGAGSAVGASQGGGATTQAPIPSPAVQPTVSALDAAVQAAVGSQGGLAGLLADLEAALQSGGLPPAVQAAAEQVLDAQLPLDDAPTAEALQQAVAQSGLFLEADLAATGAPTGGDLKAALLTLGQALEGWSGARPSGAGGARAPAPPYRDGPLQGQPAARASLGGELPAETVAGRLAQETSAATARQLLMQAGSTALRGGGGKAGPHWLFELPLATAQGPATAQFEIDADETKDGQDPDEQTWRARFSLDLAGSGPVHAKVALRGGKLRVSLWAEQDATRASLDQSRDELLQELGEEGLEAQVIVLPGAPEAAPPPAGRFLSRSV